MHKPGSASEITKRRPGASPTLLPPAYDGVLGEYAAALERAAVGRDRSRVRMYLSWLAGYAAPYCCRRRARCAG
ncbi:hypothetical protein [Nonomuraea jiangxiensis]|uniref:hypothetical protein n=1 Tax=Nonomuraea jiangxiensis TaxID=633440 RepID=UPI000B867278|nr:hypothetical protein [Nonomuraea jiangxiensis]